MKTTNSDTPRWLCQAARGSRAMAGDAALGAGHIEQCAECQAYFGACDDLDNLLRHDAGLERSLVPAGLEQRLIYAVNRSTRTAAAPRARFNLVAFSSSLAGAALLALLFFARPAVVDDRPSRNPSVQASQTTISLQEAGLRWNALAEPVAMLATNPLEAEMDSVYSDAKSALRFLELNFLPSGARSSE